MHVSLAVFQAGLSDIEALTDVDDDHGLLCMESFDLSDVTDQPINKWVWFIG